MRTTTAFNIEKSESQIMLKGRKREHLPMEKRHKDERREKR